MTLYCPQNLTPYNRNPFWSDIWSGNLHGCVTNRLKWTAPNSWRLWHSDVCRYTKQRTPSRFSPLFYGSLLNFLHHSLFCLWFSCTQLFLVLYFEQFLYGSPLYSVGSPCCLFLHTHSTFCSMVLCYCEGYLIYRVLFCWTQEHSGKPLQSESLKWAHTLTGPIFTVTFLLVYTALYGFIVPLYLIFSLRLKALLKLLPRQRAQCSLHTSSLMPVPSALAST